MTHAHSPSTRRRRGGWIFLTLLAALPILAGWLYREATAVPDFYAEALAAGPPPQAETAPPPPEVAVAADQLEREVLTLQNQVQRAEPWRLVLKEDDINAWLATELREKLPHLLPKEVKDPRIVVRDKTVYFACKHEGIFGGVFSVALEPSLTERPNEVAVRVQRFNLGRIPLPQKQYLDQITDAAARANVALQWAEEDGSAVAMIQIPAQQASNRQVQVESLQVGEGEVVIAGRAEKLHDVSTKNR